MYIYQSFVRPKPEQFATTAEYNVELVKYLNDELERVKKQRNEFEAAYKLGEKRIANLARENKSYQLYINKRQLRGHENEREVGDRHDEFS